MLNLQRYPYRCGTSWLVLALLSGWPLLLGCKPEEKITRYTIPKPSLIDTATVTPASDSAKSEPQQMLGAIVLVGDVGWFFKATGAPEALAPQAESFVSFVKSIKFAGGADPEPKWTLPTGWNELPASGLRHATILLGSATTEPGPTGADVSEQLELSVTRLGKSETDDTEYVLSNVNRWRGQLQLPPLTAGDLPQQSIATKVDGHAAYLVNMTGSTAGGGGMPMAPFANQGAGGRPTPSLAGGPIAKASASQAGGSQLKFETPEGWTAGPTNQFRKASFVVSDGDKSAEISVIDLPAPGNDWLPNVNRWRGQVGLPSLDEAEVEKQTKGISVGQQQGQYVELVGETETLLGVMLVEGNTAWFIKLKGDKQLAEREKSHFEQFVNSLELK